MSITGVMQMVVRRWYFAVGAVLIAILGAAAGFLATSPSYEARSTLLMLPSAVAAGDKNGPANPYTALSSSLADAGQVVAAQVMSDDSAQALAKQGSTATYVVSVDADFNAPVIQIVATGKTPASAETTLQLVTTAFTNQLRSVQVAAGAPEKTLISLSKVTTTPKPQRILKKAIRNGIAGGVIGLLLGLLPIPLLERRRLREPKAVKPAVAAASDPPQNASAPERSGLSDDLFGPTTEVGPRLQSDDSPKSRAARRRARAAQDKADEESDRATGAESSGSPATRAETKPAETGPGSKPAASDADDDEVEDERLASASRRVR